MGKHNAIFFLLLRLNNMIACAYKSTYTVLYSKPNKPKMVYYPMSSVLHTLNTYNNNIFKYLNLQWV